MFNLNQGMIPNCHEQVGTENIWANEFPTDTRCVGYEQWMQERTGFQKPAIVK